MKQATGSCSTAAGSRRATSTDARRGPSTISTARRPGTRSTPDGESPQARFFHIAGYDPAAQQLVVFGGGANGSAYKDAFGLTLPLDGSAPAWHTLSPTTAITARDQVTVALDDGVLTAFGGFGSGTFPGSVGAGTHLADTWQRQLGRRAGWRLATPADETQVAIAREGTAYAHDADGHRLCMFGGLTGDTTLADVWMADLRRPGRPRWQQLCSPTSCGPGPTARWGGHAVYDPVADRLVVFGGSTGTGSTTNDVWALELSGRPTWHELTPAGPSRRPGGVPATATTPSAGVSSCSAARPARTHRQPAAGHVGADARRDAQLDTSGRDGPQPAPRRSPAAAVRVAAGAHAVRHRHRTSATATTGRPSQRRVVPRSRRRLGPVGPARRRLAERRARSPALGQRRLGPCRRPALVVFGRDAQPSSSTRPGRSTSTRTDLVSAAGLRGHVL